MKEIKNIVKIMINNGCIPIIENGVNETTGQKYTVNIYKYLMISDKQILVDISNIESKLEKYIGEPVQVIIRKIKEGEK